MYADTICLQRPLNATNDDREGSELSEWTKELTAAEPSRVFRPRAAQGTAAQPLSVVIADDHAVEQGVLAHRCR
jgi:hypothetical protein